MIHYGAMCVPPRRSRSSGKGGGSAGEHEGRYARVAARRATADRRGGRRAPIARPATSAETSREKEKESGRDGGPPQPPALERGGGSSLSRPFPSRPNHTGLAAMMASFVASVVSSSRARPPLSSSSLLAVEGIRCDAEHHNDHSWRSVVRTTTDDGRRAACAPLRRRGGII